LLLQIRRHCDEERRKIDVRRTWYVVSNEQKLDYLRAFPFWAAASNNEQPTTKQLEISKERGIGNVRKILTLQQPRTSPEIEEWLMSSSESEQESKIEPRF
jgi:hypothetical protein